MLRPCHSFNGQILDGRNRYNACKDLGIEPKFNRLKDDVDPVKYVVSANPHRRHLKESQRAMAAARIADLKRGDNQHSEEGVSIETTSAMLNASKATTKRCKKILNDGVPELARLVEKGKLPASVAEDVAKLSKEKQTELLKKPVSQIKAAIKGDPKVSDNVDDVENAYVKKLQELKDRSFDNADAAVGKLMKRLQDMGFKVTMKK